MSSHSPEKIDKSNQSTRVTVNVKLLAASLGLLVLITVSGYFWYGYQQDQLGSALLERAKQFEDERQWSKASDYYQRYLIANPEDTEVLVRLVEAYAKDDLSQNRRERLIDLLYRALARDPLRDNLRLMLADNLLRVYALEEAEEEASKLLKNSSGDVQLGARKIVAIAKYFRSDVDNSTAQSAAIEELMNVASELPGDAELVAIAAAAVREHPTLVDSGDVTPATFADQLMNRLVDTSPDDIKARIARYKYRDEYKLPDAQADLERALEINPDNVDALLLSARSLVPSESADGQVESVEASLRRAIELAPLDARAYFLLAALYDQTDRGDLAVELLQRGGDATGLTVEFGIETAKRQLRGNLISDAEKTIQKLERDSVVYMADKSAAVRAFLENEITLLESRLALAQGKSQDAIRHLETMLLTSAQRSGDDIKLQWLQAAELLSEIEESEGRWDRAAEYRSRIADRAPSAPRAIQAAAEAKLRVGDYRGAIVLIERFAERGTPPDEMRVLLLRSHLANQATRLPQDRIWSEFDRALQEAKSNLPDRWEVVVAEASALSARGNRDAAGQLMRAAEPNFTESADFWRAASTTYQELGEDYSANLTRALGKHGEVAESKFAHAQLEITILVRQQRIPEAIKKLEELKGSAAVEDRVPWEELRADLFAANGEFDESLDVYSGLITANPKNELLLYKAAELAIRSNNREQADKWTDRLVELTGNGDDARFLKYLMQLGRYDELTIEDQSALEANIAELRRERPRWHKTATLAGALALLTGDNEQALAEYRSAISLGDRSPATFQALVVLLYQFGRFDDANNYLGQMSSVQAANPFVDAMSVQIAVAQDRPEVALAMAHEAVARKPNDATARIRLANLLVRERKVDEALQVLLEAANKFQTDDRVWTALFSTMVQAGQVDKARATLAALIKSQVLPPDRRHEIAAQGYELIGDQLEARKQYELSITQQPSRVDVRLKYARLLSSTAPATARSEYEQILKTEPDNEFAARGLAMLLAATGNPEDWARASKLLQAQETSSENSAEDDRLRVLLLANKGRTRDEKIENCRMAGEIVQRLIESSDTRTNFVNRQLYAQVLERQARLTGDESTLLLAQEQWKAIADNEAITTEQLLAYVEFLIRHCQAGSLTNQAIASNGPTAGSPKLRESFVSEAEDRIKQLKAMPATQPEGIAQLAIVLSSRLLVASGNFVGAKQAIDEYAASYQTTEDPQRLQAIGQMYASIEAYAEAEAWFRRLMEQERGAYLMVVQCLVEQGKRREAASLAVEVAGAQPSPEEAAILANVLTATGDPTESTPEAEAVIASTMEAYGQQVNLLQSAAVMKASRGQYDEAIAIFRRIIELEPENTLALNNLATLLAERPNQRSEALEYIESALLIAGRDTMLLDTQGTIYLKLEEADKAVDCLEEATAGGVNDARYYLHLAAAYQLAGRTSDSSEALRESRRLGLENFVLTDDDRQMLDQLDASTTDSSGTN